MWVTIPAQFEPALSRASPSPNAPVPASVSPSQVSVALGGGSPVLRAPGVHVQLFPVAWGGGVDKNKKWNIQQTFPFHTSTYLNNTSYYVYYPTMLPAHLCSSTGALHPLLHSLFLHLLEWQDVLIFVGKRTLPALHHLKLGTGRRQMWTTANW